MANQGVLSRVEINNTTVLGPQGVLARVELDSTVAGGPQGILARVELNSSAVGGPQGVLSRVELSVPGTVSAGPDQVNIEPYTMIFLVGTDTASSTDPRTWVQVSGPAVSDLVQSGKTAQCTAPGTILGATLVFGYSAATSPQDQVSVAVLPVTERVVRGGVEVPAKLMLVRL